MKYTTNNQHTSSGISHFHVQDPPHKHHRCVCCARLFSIYIETSFLLNPSKPKPTKPNPSKPKPSKPKPSKPTKPKSKPTKPKPEPKPVPLSG